MTAAVAPISGYTGFARASGIGTSSVARDLGGLVSRIIDHQRNTGSAQVQVIDTIDRLMATYRNSQNVNWGGSDELPISYEVVKEAESLLETLPSRFQSPDVVPEPSGALAFEWRFGRFRSIILSVSGKGVVEYAGIIGKNNQFFGKWDFAGELPFVIHRFMTELTRG